MHKFKTGKQAIDALPKSLRIGALDWQIERWNAAQAQGANRFGECSHVEQIIRIDSAIVSPARVADILFHEVNHAIYARYRLNDDDKEERVVALFATGWLQVFRDNLQILVWLQRCC